jgi:hypothetical protein
VGQHQAVAAADILEQRGLAGGGARGVVRVVQKSAGGADQHQHIVVGQVGRREVILLVADGGRPGAGLLAQFVDGEGRDRNRRMGVAAGTGIHQNLSRPFRLGRGAIGQRIKDGKHILKLRDPGLHPAHDALRAIPREAAAARRGRVGHRAAGAWPGDHARIAGYGGRGASGRLRHREAGDERRRRDAAQSDQQARSGCQLIRSSFLMSLLTASLM